VLWNGHALLLMPAPGRSDFAVLEAAGEDALGAHSWASWRACSIRRDSVRARSRWGSAPGKERHEREASAARRPPILTSLALAGCADKRGGVHASGTIEMDESTCRRWWAAASRACAWTKAIRCAPATLSRCSIAGRWSRSSPRRRPREGRAAAQLADLRAGPRRAEIEAAPPSWPAVAAQAAVTEAEFRRTQALFDQHLAAPADLDRARSARDMAAARQRTAAEQVRLLASGYRAGQIAAAAHAVERRAPSPPPPATVSAS